MDKETMTKEEYDKFVKEGDWFLDELAPDFNEKLLKDMKERGTI
jgi:hypothetical protein